MLWKKPQWGVKKLVGLLALLGVRDVLIHVQEVVLHVVMVVQVVAIGIVIQVVMVKQILGNNLG